MILLNSLFLNLKSAARTVGRTSGKQRALLTVCIDIYIAIVSSAHNVCPKGYYIAIVSTIAETSSNHHLELQPGFERLGKIEERFLGPPIPLYEPLESGNNDNIFISKSYDATSHFETTTGVQTCIYEKTWC